jgi:hypothetical protein
VFCFEQQDLADPTLGKEIFNYGRGSQQEEPPLFAPYLPQGSQYPCAQSRKKESPGPICCCTYAQAGQGIQGQGSKASRDRSGRFLVVQRFHFCEQFGKPIPCKNAPKFRVAKAVSKVKSTKKASKKKDNEEMDIGFLSAVKKMQIEDKYNMLDSDDDVLSLNVHYAKKAACLDIS